MIAGGDLPGSVPQWRPSHRSRERNDPARAQRARARRNAARASPSSSACALVAAGDASPPATARAIGAPLSSSFEHDGGVAETTVFALVSIALGVVTLSAAAMTLGWVAWAPRARRSEPASPARNAYAAIELAFAGGCAPRFDGVTSVTRPSPRQILIASRRGERFDGTLILDAGGASMSGRIPLTSMLYATTGLTVSVGDGEPGGWGNYPGYADPTRNRSPARSSCGVSSRTAA